MACMSPTVAWRTWWWSGVTTSTCTECSRIIRIANYPKKRFIWSGTIRSTRGIEMVDYYHLCDDKDMKNAALHQGTQQIRPILKVSDYSRQERIIALLSAIGRQIYSWQGQILNTNQQNIYFSDYYHYFKYNNIINLPSFIIHETCNI